MKKIRIGVLCPSEIAFRRFMPALALSDNFEYIGIAAATENEWFGEGGDTVVGSELTKAENFRSSYGGDIFSGYSELISSDKTDAVYIPLPPGLHYKWGRFALESGKHVFMEKPFTVSEKDTAELIEMAGDRGLSVHENYMFVYHSQIKWIMDKLAEGVIGETRLIRIDFGFPFRGANDFRYNKALGGGALLDCGGYTLRLASMFLGGSAKITASRLNSKEGFEVDIYGNATLVNDNGLTAQVSFGMDNSYKCSLEIWGSKGTIFTNRILTAPAGFEPEVIIRNDEGEQVCKLPGDDTFRKSIDFFGECVRNEQVRKKHYNTICKQSRLVESIGR